MSTNQNLSHPKGLYVLFATEMWERFNYYGMRAILVLFMTKALLFSKDFSSQLYGGYTSLVYLTPLIGGYFADRFWGNQRSIIIGGLVMAIGEFILFFCGSTYTSNPELSTMLFFTGLGFMISGNGFFKPNISTLLGKFYSEDDPKRDAGFSFFYVGINLGAFTAPLIIGFVGETIDWHLGFSLAAFGMLLGLIQYVFNQEKIIRADLSRQTKKMQIQDWLQIIFISFITIPFVFLCIELHQLFKNYSFQIFIAIIIFLTLKMTLQRNTEKLSMAEVKKITYISVLSIFVIFFWMGFEQAGGSLTIFASNNIDRQIGVYEIPVTFFQSINPLIIIFLGPVIANFWLKVDSSSNKLSTPQKMGLGLLFLGLGFLLLVFIKDQINISFSWLILVYFLHTVGELCLSPIGLSMVSKVSPKKMASLLMGLWFLSAAAANYVAGRLPEMVTNFDWDLFIFLTLTSIISAVILFLIAPLLEKLLYQK